MAKAVLTVGVYSVGSTVRLLCGLLVRLCGWLLELTLPNWCEQHNKLQRSTITRISGLCAALLSLTEEEHFLAFLAI